MFLRQKKKIFSSGAQEEGGSDVRIDSFVALYCIYIFFIFLYIFFFTSAFDDCNKKASLICSECKKHGDFLFCILAGFNRRIAAHSFLYAVC